MDVPSVHTAHQVLIVDDNDDLRESLALVLRLEGFSVAPAWGAEDALRHLREGFRPCVVILDLRMPGIDGWGFYDRLQLDPELATIPVIVVSGEPREEQHARQRGICQFFVKPIDPVQLVAAVGRHCRRHAPP